MKYIIVKSTLNEEESDMENYPVYDSEKVEFELSDEFLEGTKYGDIYRELLSIYKVVNGKYVRCFTFEGGRSY